MNFLKTNDIFKDIGATPVQCLTFAPSTKGKETLSPHNFLLKNGSTLSIRTNKTGDKVAPRVVGQCGLFVFNAFFSELAGFEIEDKEQIKGVVLKSIHRMIPTFLDYHFVSDYTVWVRCDDGEYSYTIFDRNQFVDIEPEREHFSFTKDGEAWNESTTLKYKGISIAEIQIHKNRTFKFRFIMKAMQKFLVEAKMTTETFGMTAEKAICDIFGLSYPANFKTRCSARLQEEIMPIVKAAFTELPNAVKHTGSEQGVRGKESKCSYDFVLAGGQTLSLKTNTGKMVCPPEVGQPGAETCYLYFKHLTDATEITEEVFKEMVLNRIAEMMPIYVEHLLDSDYLLWIYKKKNDYEYKIFNSDFAKNMVWDIGTFTFTKPTVEEWNENIHRALKYAVKTERIKDNPAANIELPKKQKHIADFYSPEELKTLLKAAKGTDIETVIYIAAWLGLRRGEILGLKWSYVDFVNQTISVKGTIARAEKTVYKETAKNASSYCVVVTVVHYLCKIRQQAVWLP